MAGLTKAQRTERSQKESNETKEEAPKEVLISMCKNIDLIRVHPTCVEAHKNAGWTIAAE